VRKPDNIVGHNKDEDLCWARSATKHRISHERSRHVIEHCGLRFREEPPDGTSARDPRIVLLGDDADGIALEVMAIELDDDRLLAIHAMPLRTRYREQYTEARKWRR
jgi:hypothetical protein